MRVLLLCAVLLALLPTSLSEAQFEFWEGVPTIMPMHGKRTIRCPVQGAGGIAIYVAKWNGYGGISSLWLEYVTKGFYSTKQARWKGLYRWYKLDLFTSEVGHVGSGQCSGP